MKMRGGALYNSMEADIILGVLPQVGGRRFAPKGPYRTNVLTKQKSSCMAQVFVRFQF